MLHKNSVMLKFLQKEKHFLKFDITLLYIICRWVVESRLDKLEFARQKLAYCFFSSAATLFPPELSDARISWAKNGVLTTVVDDFFDVGSSQEEQVNLIQLVEEYTLVLKAVKSLDFLFEFYHFFSAKTVMLCKWNCRWDVDVNSASCSEAVKIIFSAVRSTICEIGERSVERQGRNVKDNVIKIVRCFFILLLTLFY